MKVVLPEPAMPMQRSTVGAMVPRRPLVAAAGRSLGPSLARFIRFCRVVCPCSTLRSKEESGRPRARARERAKGRGTLGRKDHGAARTKRRTTKAKGTTFHMMNRFEAAARLAAVALSGPTAASAVARTWRPRSGCSSARGGDSRPGPPGFGGAGRAGDELAAAQAAVGEAAKGHAPAAVAAAKALAAVLASVQPGDEPEDALHRAAVEIMAASGTLRPRSCRRARLGSDTGHLKPVWSMRLAQACQSRVR